MEKGIPCFDNKTTNEKNETSLFYQFVSGNKEIASSCRVTLGDMDPRSGERITDRTIFTELRHLQYIQAYYNRQEDCVSWTKREREAQDEMRHRITEEFVNNYDYAPDKDTLEWMLQEKWPKKYRVHMDGFTEGDDGENFRDSLLILEDRSAADDLQKAECALDEFAETLDEREHELFNLLLLKSEGFNIHGMVNTLADKWGVEQYAVSRMKKKIGLKLLDWLKEED